jgi:hypothetical protein
VDADHLSTQRSLPASADSVKFAFQFARQLNLVKNEKQPCVSLTIQVLQFLKVIYYTFAVGVSAKSAVSVEV